MMFLIAAHFGLSVRAMGIDLFNSCVSSHVLVGGCKQNCYINSLHFMILYGWNTPLVMGIFV